MKFFSFALVLVTCSAWLAPGVRAATYTEAGDAGDLPANAQTISGPSGTALTQINGALTLTNNTSDSDMFKIYISNPSAFAVTMVAGQGHNTFDSQLAVFNASGMGIKANDDAANGSPQAALPAGALTGQAAGVYYLLISGSGRYATDASGNLIFPNYNDGTTDPTGTYGPNNASAVIAGYTGYSSEAGSYILTLSGSQFVPVPEPVWTGAFGGVVAGWALWRQARCRRVMAAARNVV